MAEALFKFYVKERQTSHAKNYQFFVICANLQIFTELILFQVDISGSLIVVLMKHIFLQIFGQFEIDYTICVDYAIRFCG